MDSRIGRGLICAAVVAMGCCAAYADPVTENLKVRADMGRLMACEVTNMELLDDRTSPATVVAKAIAEACAPELEAYGRDGEAALGATEGTTEGVLAKMQTGQMFVGDVLKHRTGHYPKP